MINHFDIICQHLSDADRRYGAMVDVALAAKHGTAAYRQAMVHVVALESVRDALTAVRNECLGLSPAGSRLTEREDNTSEISTTKGVGASTD